MKLSACLVIHNEEKLLPRCLESIKDIADEIIVVHDGPCKDKSLEIAKKFGAKVFSRPFIGEAEYHRPFSYSKAKGEWILQIDADEFLLPKTREAISKLVRAEDVDAYSFSWPYHDGKDYIRFGPFAKTQKPCLFRKRKMYMIGISHEYPRTYGVLQKRTDLQLGHLPLHNNLSQKVLQSKWVRWAKLQARQIFHIEEAPTYNINRLKLNPIYTYYINMRRFPILSGICECFKFLLIYLTRGILWSSSYSVKVAFFELKYLWLVRFYLFKFKYGRRI